MSQFLEVWSLSVINCYFPYHSPSSIRSLSFHYCAKSQKNLWGQLGAHQIKLSTPTWYKPRQAVGIQGKRMPDKAGGQTPLWGTAIEWSSRTAAV